MQPPKEEEVRPIEGEQVEQEQEEEQITGKGKTALNQRLINSVKKNQYEEVERCLKKRADVNYEENNKKKWTAFIWACCLGNMKMVKLLISKSAAQQYLESKPEYRIVVMGSTKEIRPNPLHWASFKGHLDIMQLLIKTGLHWEDIDNFGNNSVMLTASANFADIFKKYLQIGVLIQCKNSRGHTAKDLTTHPEIVGLINAHDKTHECPISKTGFKEKEPRHWCWVCGKFFSAKCFRVQWSLKDLRSEEKNEIDGRCSQCWNFSSQMQKDLTEAMDSKDESRLRKTINSYKQKFIQLDITFLDVCQKLLHKLEVQNSIIAFVENLCKVQNYKVILKSVNQLQQMLKNALPLGIDKDVVESAEKTIERLNAERNLRFEIDNIDTSSATREGVAKLESLYTDASDLSVSGDYLEVAGGIKDKMTRSIRVQDICQMFVQYPPRPDPYPDPLVIDFKTKKPLDPETKKPTDAANLLPKKKKGKKDPKFVVPEWATELKEMNDIIKEQEELLSMRQDLGMSVDQCKKVEEMIALMKRESRYRKDMDTLQAMVDEANKKKK